MTRADAYIEVKQVFKVARSIMYDCLLGIDFMKAHNAILDIDKEVITLKSDDTITLHKLIEMSDSTYNVSMPSDVLIEKRSQVVLVAQVAFPPKQELVNSGKDVIFTPSPQQPDSQKIVRFILS